MTQLEYATKNMIEWLSHPSELGHKPAKIIFCDTFILDDLKYYIFKYKDKLVGKWLLGVSGGYSGDELITSGHTYSEMKEFKEETAINEAKELVEMVKSYWKDEANKIEEKKANRGTFVGFVLLENNKFNIYDIVNNLNNMFNLNIKVNEEDLKEDVYVTSIENSILSICLMNGPIPKDELDVAASNNYISREYAHSVVDKHKCHIMVAVSDKKSDIRDTSLLFIKAMAACASFNNVLGLYANDTIYEPRMYIDIALGINEDNSYIPIDDLVWINIVRDNDMFSAYTTGLVQFGFNEIEVIDVDIDPYDLRNFVYDIVCYVIYYDVLLNDGETIGFSEDDKHAISVGDGLYVLGKSVKINYKAN